MHYRSFGKTGWKTSALAFGCMRLPTLGAPDTIDEPLATRMIRTAVDAGVNYVDTAYPYHGGKSEVLVGKALKDGYREKVHLATKMPVWLAKEKGDFDRIFNEQLKRLQTDHVDLYLYHSLGRANWDNAKRLDILEWGERQVKAGRIRWIGFSFHDQFPVFKEIVDAYDKWTFCMIFYNYASQKIQAGMKGLRYAAEKGLAVSIMEPLMGGNLINPPPAVEELWNTSPVKRTPADWALQWVWNQPEVGAVLSGMGSMKQVEENLASAERSKVGLLTKPELDVVTKVAEAYTRLRPIPCTQCGYCMPCPHGVDIPRVMDIYNKSVAFSNPEGGKEDYKWVKPEERAGNCAECLECEGKCPQNVPVHEWLHTIQEAFGG